MNITNEDISRLKIKYNSHIKFLKYEVQLSFQEMTQRSIFRNFGQVRLITLLDKIISLMAPVISMRINGLLNNCGVIASWTFRVRHGRHGRTRKMPCNWKFQDLRSWSRYRLSSRKLLFQRQWAAWSVYILKKKRQSLPRANKSFMIQTSSKFYQYEILLYKSSLYCCVYVYDIESFLIISNDRRLLYFNDNRYIYND